MARIRTIKPEFWTDEKIVQVSIPSRLLFIGLWNFADDSGNLENSPTQIKMRVLPADTVDVLPLLQELITTGLLREYSVSGKNYLNIPGFNSHQVINKPSKTRLPEPPTTGVLPDGREGKGSRKGKEGKGEDAPVLSNDEYIEQVKTDYNRMIETPKKTEQWRTFYNGHLDIDRTLFAACTWLVENPHKRRTRLKQFYGNWLRKTFQDKAVKS